LNRGPMGTDTIFRVLEAGVPEENADREKWLSVPIWLSVLLLAGCGYVGEPLPPSLGIPHRISDVSVKQHADKLVVRFTAPGETTDGVLIRRLERVEMRVGGAEEARRDAEGWAEQARSIENSVAAPGPATVEVPAREWAGRDVIVAVRAWGRKGRPSEWSNLVTFRVAAPLEQPSGLKAEATAAGVRLAWDGPRGATFRVLRNEVELAVAEKDEYVDATARYGQSYRYAVQAMLKTGDSVAESEVSESVSITPEDRFAPAVPAGLVAVAGVRSVALNWERSRELDLKGYYLYRSVEGGAFQRVGGLLEVPAASDPGIEPGRRYRYAVTAADQRDNESARSEASEITVPQ